MRLRKIDDAFYSVFVRRYVAESEFAGSVRLMNRFDNVLR